MSYKGCASAYLLFHGVAKPDLHPQQWKESHISILPLIPTSSNPLNRQTLPPCHLPVLHWRTTCKTTELNECLSKLLSIYTDCPKLVILSKIENSQNMSYHPLLLFQLQKVTSWGLAPCAATMSIRGDLRCLFGNTYTVEQNIR